MKILSVLLIMTIMLAQDCRKRSTDTTDSTTETQDIRKVIKMVKNPCFGQCPIYSLTISNDGTVVYVGKKFTPKMGTYSKKIPKEQVTALLKGFDAIKFWEMKDKYPSEVTDLAKTIITLFKKDVAKTVVGDNSSRPEALLKMDEQLVAIADSEEGWILTEKHPDAKDLPDHFIKNEIITKFKPDIDIPHYIESQKKYDLAIKKRVAPNLDLWVLTFDTLKIDPSLMLNQLKEAPEVLEASFNKKLKPREH